MAEITNFEHMGDIVEEVKGGDGAAGQWWEDVNVNYEN